VRIFQPRGVRIVATGSYLPARVVDNAELIAEGAPLTAEEMVRLTGIQKRHRAAPEEATSDLAASAARRALARAQVEPAQVQRLIVGTVSPDYSSPSAACLAHKALGLRQAPALDVTASCSGFLYALDCAARAVATGEENVLAVAADIRSRYVDPTDRATCALFGDGAGAALLASGPADAGLLAIGLAADGAGAHDIYVPAGGSREPASAQTVAARRHRIHMADGPQIYFAAVEGMIAVAQELLAALGLSFAEVDLVIPHQANQRILERVARLASLPAEKMFINVDRVGNISGATCAVALDEALRSGRAPAGARVLLISAGAGYTAGAALLAVDAELAGRSQRNVA
jgi:3-oxoacyl-[acyl-carrier-protein] synthase-3